MRHNRRVNTNEIRETFLRVLRGPRPQAAALGVARAVRLRPLRAAHDGGHAPARAVLPRRGEAAASAPGDRAEVLPHDRHRQRRQHRAPPDVLRDARQLLDRRLLQAGSRRDGLGAVARRLRLRRRRHLDHGLRGRRRSSASVPTRRRSRRGCPSACRSSGSCSARARRTSGRAARPGRAGRAASCTSTAAWSTARADDLPGGENERFLEYWNLVFTQYDMGVDADGRTTLAPLPANNIDTGLGLERMAVIQQGVETVFETDTFAPLMALGRELASGRPRRARAAHPRRPLARDDVPHRRRRRAVQRGPRLHPAADHAPRDPAGQPDRHAARLHAASSPSRSSRSWAPPTRSSSASARPILRWARGEEEGFGRTLEQGDEAPRRRHRALPRDGTIPALGRLQLHDTFGFPFDVTRELAAERGPGGRHDGFEVLMEEQRARARARRPRRARRRRRRRPRQARALSRDAGFETDFTGYETLEQHTTVGSLCRRRRPAAREARRVAVLRDGRRPGRGRRGARVRERRLPAVRHRRPARR